MGIWRSSGPAAALIVLFLAVTTYTVPLSMLGTGPGGKGLLVLSAVQRTATELTADGYFGDGVVLFRIAEATAATGVSTLTSPIEAVEEFLAGGCPDSYSHRCSPPLHYHTTQDEHFEVLEGGLRWRSGAESGIARAGDHLVMPAGQAHTFCRTNVGGTAGKTRVRSWLEPPGPGGRAYFEELVGLARDGAGDLEHDVLVCSNAIRLSSWLAPELWCTSILAASEFAGHTAHHTAYSTE